MDASKSLPIRKHTTLLKRLPETLFASQLDKAKANWVVFAEYLSPRHFEDIDFFTGFYNPILETWKVGQYEVALMAGDLTPQHETILQSLNLDYASLNEVPDLSTTGLIVFDMDSTAIQIECIDEIAKLAGVGQEVAEVTERAMLGELDFEQSLRQRVGKLKGADEAILEQVRSRLSFMPDFEALIATLKALGWKTAIASGGFTYFSDHIKNKVDLDFAQSNQLEVINGKLTGKVIGDVVTAQMKSDILVELADEYEIEQHNTVSVGDGANDLLMMSVAGLGIAYHAKPKVEAQAQAAIRFAGLGGVLCILSGALVKQHKVSWKAKP
ncbi:phosphoserine phosphatase [Vibrio sp. ES.051]|uniref:phosphoserine phosphatase n=1 Tax=Vibrio sp. ES.051 TaxID=1761909 RepID=UPI000BF9F97A|nr:phosphoserine phosphatase [Vibrio sp. ES.051]PFG55447.1 phosphoserine phosphatase [Vibrio sp. ES.051]